MKYMTFNSSCSYAGLANMLFLHGIDTTDRQIALDMGLPYYFACEDGMYLAGPSLQSADWFNLYLHPRGFTLLETPLLKSAVPDYLQGQTCAMLGLKMEGQGKHAVIYSGIENGMLRFLNNKWQQEPSPETLLLTEEELLSRLDDTCMVATLRTIPPQPAPIPERLESSLTVLRQYHGALTALCSQPHPTQELRAMLNPMFRALLLDGITMMELLGNTELHTQLTTLQRSFLTALRREDSDIRLADHLSLDLLKEAVENYSRLIQAQLET